MSGALSQRIISNGCSVLLALNFAGCSKGSPTQNAIDRPATAWWYDATFTPDSAAVDGIAANSIDANWRQAAALSEAVVKQRWPSATLQDLKDSNASFSLDADLDHDGINEHFQVGVFKTNDGETGRFVLITSNGQIRQRFSLSGSPGFSALVRVEDEVRWYECLQCGGYEGIRWTGSAYALD